MLHCSRTVFATTPTELLLTLFIIIQIKEETTDVLEIYSERLNFCIHLYRRQWLTPRILQPCDDSWRSAEPDVIWKYCQIPGGTVGLPFIYSDCRYTWVPKAALETV